MFSQIKAGMVWVEYEAMDRFGISTEAEWYALHRDERARKVAYIKATSIINSIVSYENVHIKSKP